MTSLPRLPHDRLDRIGGQGETQRLQDLGQLVHVDTPAVVRIELLERLPIRLEFLVSQLPRPQESLGEVDAGCGLMHHSVFRDLGVRPRHHAFRRQLLRQLVCVLVVRRPEELGEQGGEPFRRQRLVLLAEFREDSAERVDLRPREALRVPVQVHQKHDLLEFQQPVPVQVDQRNRLLHSTPQRGVAEVGQELHDLLVVEVSTPVGVEPVENLPVLPDLVLGVTRHEDEKVVAIEGCVGGDSVG
mmetsp:Transcript_86027/g.248373  ORF Transcript_86027/g.248373 Transcript_86027/m.248373 type:complete len:244 (+) Transcript_86027:1288-2019(+)